MILAAAAAVAAASKFGVVCVISSHKATGLLKKKVFQKHKIVLKIDRNYGYRK
jgi:hypothetical protein